MDRSYLIDCIIGIIKTNELVKTDINIDENTSLYKECCINSIEIIELIVRIEEMFDFEFNSLNLVLADFETVSQISDIVLSQLSTRRPFNDII